MTIGQVLLKVMMLILRCLVPVEGNILGTPQVERQQVSQIQIHG